MSLPPQNQSQLDNEPFLSIIVKLVDQGKTNSYIATYLSNSFHYGNQGIFRITVSPKAIARFRHRHGLALPSNTPNRASTKVEGNKAEVTTDAKRGVKLDDPDAMLEERGLDPTEWDIEGATINEWDGPSQEGPVTYHQAKLRLVRKVDKQIFAARSDGWQAPAILKRPDTEGSKLIVITGDQQAPFHDERLHYLFCGWLAENEPDELVALGDKVDFPDISRHRLDPENTAVVNECIQVGYDLFRGYRMAAPNTRMQFMPGNHDLRIRDLILDKPSVQPLYGVKQADGETEGPSVLGLPHLLRLDELRVEYIDPHGPYELAQINLSDKLAVRHGWIVRQGSGTSALATLEHLGYSVITGHTHRQSLVHKTKHEINGDLRQIVGVEAGCMCRVNQTLIKGRKWPNFATSPDWQPGFATVNMWPDGAFKIDLATFINDRLYWRDQRYE